MAEVRSNFFNMLDILAFWRSLLLSVFYLGRRRADKELRFMYYSLRYEIACQPLLFLEGRCRPGCLIGGKYRQFCSRVGCDTFFDLLLPWKTVEGFAN